MTASVDIPKIKEWKEVDLSGLWSVGYKIDGVRAHIKDGKAVSKSGKPLSGLNGVHVSDGVYEVYTGKWNTSISAVRGTLFNGIDIPEDILYSLNPLDPRLVFAQISNPSCILINRLMGRAIRHGYEGLVLRQGDTWLKVKPVKTFDVAVTGIVPGKGRNEGRMGALVTPMGNVGTGFTDGDRQCFYSIPIGTIIEVECMELTDNGKFRHPRFVRLREDI